MKTKNPDDQPLRFVPGDRIAVLLPLPLPGPLDYVLDENTHVAVGDFVDVDLAGRRRTGIVCGPGESGLAKEKLKPVIEKRDGVMPLPRESLEFMNWCANYTLSPPGAILKMMLSVPAALDPPKPVMVCVLAKSPGPWRKTKARQKVVDYLGANPPDTVTGLAKSTSVGAAVIRGLVTSGVLETAAVHGDAASLPKPDPFRPGHDLSKAQARAADQFQAAIGAQKFHVTLLEGVPGSGKTEVYFEGVAKALASGKQVLVLLPEIALTSQWRERFKHRFGAAPVEWHSGLTPAKRRDTWRAVQSGQAEVVVGARSALFLPFRNLGLIVVDEEHDPSFKQEEGVFYNARDMAVVRAHIGSFAVLLASATPSLESLNNVASGRYQGVHLPDRHGGALLPEIEVVDMVKDGPPSGQWLSEPLKDMLAETFARNEQALLFLNRRGYAPLTLCRKCGHRFQCPRCSSWLVEHHFNKRLQCHHCGYFTARPDICPECEGEQTLAACGPGVERLAEEARILFPEIRMAIADSDHVTSPGAAAELVRNMERRETDLIIGTQMIAKGYHFPYLTLVGVVDADLGLQGGDLRAAERTFQMLYQVAGRAGRSEHPGRVVLQSYEAGHTVINAIKTGDRDDFYRQETSAREIAGMPPFGRLVGIIVSGVDEQAVDDVARGFARTAPTPDGVQVWGPAPAPLAFLRGRHRRRLLLKAEKDISVQPLMRHWLKQNKVHKSVRIQVDVDPISFM